MDKEKIEQFKIHTQQWLYEVEEYVHQIPPTQLYAAVGVVLFTMILFLIRHSRLRPKLDEFLPQAAGIVFVVDSVEFLPNSRTAAEYLYEVLTKATVIKKKIPVLLLCNKVDKITAHTKEFIRKQLEKEIDKLRTSRTAVSEADISNKFTLGVPGEPFGFSQCCNKVIVAEASGLTGEISQLEQFIRENVKP